MRPPEWEMLGGVPDTIDQAPTAWYLGIEAVYPYKATAGRRPFTGGSPA
jgi:hypothetical protein